MMDASVCSPAEALVVLGHDKSHLLLHVHAILAGTCLNEGPVKEVTIVSDIHTWLHLQQMDGECLCLIICLSITWAQSVPDVSLTVEGFAMPDISQGEPHFLS